MIKKLLSIAAVVAMPLFAANAQESVEKVVVIVFYLNMIMVIIQFMHI